MATLGGILLILGAYFTYRGSIFYAVGVYAIADFVWLYLAYSRGDFLGVTSIAIGTLLGIAAFVKMNKGTFRKSIVVE